MRLQASWGYDRFGETTRPFFWLGVRRAPGYLHFEPADPVLVVTLLFCAIQLLCLDGYLQPCPACASISSFCGPLCRSLLLAWMSGFDGPYHVGILLVVW